MVMEDGRLMIMRFGMDFLHLRLCHHPYQLPLHLPSAPNHGRAPLGALGPLAPITPNLKPKPAPMLL